MRRKSLPALLTPRQPRDDLSAAGEISAGFALDTEAAPVAIHLHDHEAALLQPVGQAFGHVVPRS